ncbi:hypothetical protein [Gordonia hydrophobica]|uniref:Uncharacterized protein n=1 Tax=Gordonia hydrophobica TaxID=40516 RepID=A0ABZ2U5M8_9ACTN|nr:hypothetical protein [Gordonia hydrophobica]MBM7365683.1 hypothetical protein [Gordonia hydrophobica]
MTDTLFADISEWQPPLDDSYPYSWLSIRSNDGTYRDRRWSHNWDTARRWLDSGRLRGVIVYVVYRSNWRDCLDVHRAMQSENRPDVVSMVDVESWGGQLVGDHSDGINRLVWGIGDWRGPRIDGRPRRVIGYWNPSADPGLWRDRPPIGFIVPSYGRSPRFSAQVQDVRRRMIAHQYTDGTIGCGGALPCGYGTVRCDMNSANGRDPEELRIATGIGVD